MPLTTIFVIRHAFRGAWDTNPRTGEVSSRFPTPTGLPADPPLTAYGERQAQELAELAHQLDPPPARIYSSPYYRCLQTIEPFAKRRPDLPLVIDRGISEWFGEAPWDQPKPAPIEDLTQIFPHLNLRQYPGFDAAEMDILKDYDSQLRSLEHANRRKIKKAEHKRVGSQSKRSTISPDGALREYQRQLERFEEQSRRRADEVEATRLPQDGSFGQPPTPGGLGSNSIIPLASGESTAELHNRLAYALDSIIDDNDKLLANDPEPKSIVVVSHAAPIIAMGRTLTGRMPSDICEKDFCTYTAGVTRFDRRQGWEQRLGQDQPVTDEADAQHAPQIQWKDGKGVRGGWDCTVNSGTDHLSGGGNRDWHFSGEESFLPSIESQPERATAANEDKSKL